MNVWLEILQFRPIEAPRWTSTNVPIREPAADPAAVQIDEVGVVDDNAILEHG